MGIRAGDKQKISNNTAYITTKGCSCIYMRKKNYMLMHWLIFKMPIICQKKEIYASS